MELNNFNKFECLSLTGNISENFYRFKQEINIYFLATDMKKMSNEIQVEKVFNLLGTDGVKLLNTLIVKERTVEGILAALEEYCIPCRNETLENFFTRKQKEGENFDQFFADLCKLSKPCNFGSCLDKLLKTQVVLGILDNKLQSRLLREDPTLKNVVKYCQLAEQNEINLRMVQEEISKIHPIERQVYTNWQERSSNQMFGKNENNSRMNNITGNNIRGNNSNSLSNRKILNCYKCGQSNATKGCPAYGLECTNCGLKNHFSVM